MAKEWYLLKTPHSQLSGFEGEALEDFGVEGFLEALDSGMAQDVELYNYDLSECTPIRVIVQNAVSDTKLKTLTRAMFTTIGTCKAGMYIKYKGRFWLIVGLVDDNMMYEKIIVHLCNYLLTWENSVGDIVQRWANITSASQYNNGETYNRNYYLRSDQLLILTPNDDECVLLDSGKRFVIDKKCDVYSKSISEGIVCDTSKPLIVYQLTRPDTVLFDYTDSGNFEFIASQEEQQKDDGYYVVDGKGYWLCGIPKRLNKSTILSCSIECSSADVYAGIEPNTYTAAFYDLQGNKVAVTPVWNISCDFIDDLTIEYVDDSVLISTDNEKLIGKTFELKLSGDGYEQCSLLVKIKAFI